METLSYIIDAFYARLDKSIVGVSITLMAYTGSYGLKSPSQNQNIIKKY